MKLVAGARLVVASHNPGKVREIMELLAPLRLAVTGAAELGLQEPEETGATFAENAKLKARAAVAATGLPALADDSGLVVFALDGAPGIFSARWAGAKKDFGCAMARVERALRQVNTKDYSAQFVSALALVEPNGQTHVFEGAVRGRLTFPPRGAKGFGYDPIFIAEGMHQTFGELDPSYKNAISHRAQAFAKLARYLSSPEV